MLAVCALLALFGVGGWLSNLCTRNVARTLRVMCAQPANDVRVFRIIMPARARHRKTHRLPAGSAGEMRDLILPFVDNGYLSVL